VRAAYQTLTKRPMMSLPEPILAVLDPFRTAFTRPTWAKALVLVTGTILARGRRTVAAALRATGHEHDPLFSRFHAVFNRARWSALELARRMLQLLVRAFAPEGGLTLAIDETLERRRGPKIAERGYHRDPIASSRSQHVAASGLRWMVLALVVTVPWNRHRWALPFLSRLAPSAKLDAARGRRHRTLAVHARQMITAVRRWLPGVPLTLLGDTTYSAMALGHACRRRGVRLIAPLGLKACLHEPLPPPTGKPGRGRPRKAGRALPKLAALRTDPATAWRPVAVAWSDGTTRTLELTSGTAWWSHTGEPPLPIRWALTRDPAGELESRAYFSTEPDDEAEAIVAEFLKRWPIETTFEECRAHLGLETQRQWSDAAIARETPCLFGLYSVIALLGRGLCEGPGLPIRAAAWYRKTEATFADVLAAVRRQCWGVENNRDPEGAAGFVRIPRPLFEGLINTACYAH
jgi:DDE superfamily endonuclease